MGKRLAMLMWSLLLGLGTGASADVFNLGPGLTSLDMVTVGDPGNTGESSGEYSKRVCGAVAYEYNIGKYEVTTSQYCDFLNSVAKTDTYSLYDTKMWNDSQGCKIQRTGASGDYSYSIAADRANRPVNWVTYWDACRFANWLHNGQPTGLQDASTTERGAYTLDGYNGMDGRGIIRNTDWKFAVTSEDEWYKAAYYKGGGANAGYWDYATQSDVTPSNILGDPVDPGNNATYYSGGYTIGAPYYQTEVGDHQNSDSTYGTFDQSGNVFEWNESVVMTDAWAACRGFRGGAYVWNALQLHALTRYGGIPIPGGPDIGFRVSRAIPEPSSVMTLVGALTSLLGLRRRRP